jgi:hypothetical protein
MQLMMPILSLHFPSMECTHRKFKIFVEAFTVNDSWAMLKIAYLSTGGRFKNAKNPRLNNFYDVHESNVRDGVTPWL